MKSLSKKSLTGYLLLAAAALVLVSCPAKNNNQHTGAQPNEQQHDHWMESVLLYSAFDHDDMENVQLRASTNDAGEVVYEITYRYEIAKFAPAVTSLGISFGENERMVLDNPIVSPPTLWKSGPDVVTDREAGMMVFVVDRALVEKMANTPNEELGFAPVSGNDWAWPVRYINTYDAPASRQEMLKLFLDRVDALSIH